MVVKIYISGISGNKEVKKRQQRVLMILDSKNIKYEIIDITEPGKETDKDFMQNNSKSNGGTVSDPNPRSPLPPQMFNDEEYCGDYDQFDLANEVDTLEQFLKLEVSPEEPPQAESAQEKAMNGDLDGEKSKDESLEPETDKANDTDQTEIIEDGSKSPLKENTPLREDGTTLKEATPTIDESEESAKPEEENEINEEKEASPERQKSIEKTESPENETTDEVNVKEASKESSPVKEALKESSPEKEASKESSPEKEESINENGTVSSREQSEEKQATVDETDVIEQKKENPSELLIGSEQAASAN